MACLDDDGAVSLCDRAGAGGRKGVWSDVPGPKAAEPAESEHKAHGRADPALAAHCFVPKKGISGRRTSGEFRHFGGGVCFFFADLAFCPVFVNFVLWQMFRP